LFDELKIDEKSNSKEQNKHSSCEAEPKDKFRHAKFFFFAVLARKSAFAITFIAIQRVSSTKKFVTRKNLGKKPGRADIFWKRRNAYRKISLKNAEQPVATRIIALIILISVRN
jgi:hypothetical protein